MRKDEAIEIPLPYGGKEYVWVPGKPREARALREGDRVVIMSLETAKKPDNELCKITKSMYNTLVQKGMIEEI